MKNYKDIAEKFNVLGKIEKFENDLLQIKEIPEVDFDLNGFIDNMPYVIIIPKYNIPVALENYYEVRRNLIHNIIETAKVNGLHRTEDRIEDYGEHLYFVFKCDDTWHITIEKV